MDLNAKVYHVVYLGIVFLIHFCILSLQFLKQLRIQCNHKHIINIPERAVRSLVYIALLVEEDHLIYGFHQCSITDQKIVGTMILLAAFMLDRVK